MTQSDVSVPKFSLIIPCYNEAEGLPELIDRCRFTAAAGGGEVILVNNGSTDNSEEILATSLNGEPHVRWVTVNPNIGYGNGILEGLKISQAKIIGWTHADLQTDPLDVLRAISELPTESRVFIKGKRFGRPLADRVFTAGMSVFESALLRSTMSDINAQPTLFSRELFESWTNPPVDFSLDLYAYYTAKKAGYKLFRFPVIFANRKYGQSHWNVDFKSKWKFIQRTMSFSFELRKKLK